MRGVPDGQLIEQIRGDRVDILVELSGQTHGNKLGAVRLRGAPVQVTYCGYPNTTGVPAVDYRIVDSLTDPSPGADRLAVEKLIRLDPCFLCYTPREDAPPIAEPPSRKNGSITFGSFNSLKKVTPSTLALWCRLVREVPGSRLVIKSGTAFARSAREHLTREILSHGLAQTRFDLLERNEAKFEHLATYEQVDIGLDTFPYHGTTTTCEAMWQGVPVVSLVGDVHAARVGLSLLSAVGLAELAARTPDEYLEIAMALAADPARLASIRSTLRPRMQASVLCNAPAFARRFEGALRHAWRTFCAANPA
jgi:predicted O-linked N-acetylglucosamine transferase (SPINDLY family)